MLRHHHHDCDNDGFGFALPFASGLLSAVLLALDECRLSLSCSYCSLATYCSVARLPRLLPRG